MKKILNRYYPVLDHGFVALVDCMGDDLAIERSARVSYGKGTRKKSDTENLIRYLIRHRHTTPVEAVELQFHMAMPIFVARQVIRHRTAGVNEYSGRYSEMPNTTYTPNTERLKVQSMTNKQGSGDNEVLGASALELLMKQEQVTSFANYQQYLDSGMAREIARVNLPLSAYTQWYFKMDLHNLMHFLSLRMDSHAQEETREYANIMASIVKQVAPIAVEAWEDYVLNAIRFTKQEREALIKLLDGETYSVDDFPTKRELSEFTSKMATIKVFDEIPELPKEYLTPEQAERRLNGN